MASNLLSVLQLLLAPMALISASGLLMLALYNRLATLVTRARTFDKEHFDVTTQVAQARSVGVLTPEDKQVVIVRLEQRGHLLSRQIRQIIWRAELVRDALIAILSAVLAMLASSLSLALSLIAVEFNYVALGLFILGLGAVGVGVTLAIRELRVALDTVRTEFISEATITLKTPSP